MKIKARVERRPGSRIWTWHLFNAEQRMGTPYVYDRGLATTWEKAMRDAVRALEITTRNLLTTMSRR